MLSDLVRRSACGAIHYLHQTGLGLFSQHLVLVTH
jgi:hypothetical protein